MRHKVFVSYHHDNDQYYRNKFEEICTQFTNIMLSKSVQIGDINEYLPTETIRQKIRDEYLRDSTVTVVLIGQETWKRKHVDWEISSTLRDTMYNSRGGLLGIVLPSYYENKYLDQNKYDKYTIPPRLSDNIDCGFSKIYNWNENPFIIQEWIHEAFLNRKIKTPDNSFPFYKNNRSGYKWQR